MGSTGERIGELGGQKENSKECIAVLSERKHKERRKSYGSQLARNIVDGEECNLDLTAQNIFCI